MSLDLGSKFYSVNWLTPYLLNFLTKYINTFFKALPLMVEEANSTRRMFNCLSTLILFYGLTTNTALNATM